jgi:hypothetical protein
MTDAAMIAIDKALRQPLIARVLARLGIRALKRIPIENRLALRTLRRHMAGHDTDRKVLASALDTVLLRIQPDLRPSAWHRGWIDDDWDSPPTIDEEAAEAARSAMMRGAVEDALHHLERALPAGYAVIAEQLTSAFRSRT